MAEAANSGIWVEAGEGLLADTIALRRAIHEEPELGLFNPKTTERPRRRWRACRWRSAKGRLPPASWRS